MEGSPKALSITLDRVNKHPWPRVLPLPPRITVTGEISILGTWALPISGSQPVISGGSALKSYTLITIPPLTGPGLPT